MVKLRKGRAEEAKEEDLRSDKYYANKWESINYKHFEGNKNDFSIPFTRLDLPIEKGITQRQTSPTTRTTGMFHPHPSRDNSYFTLFVC